LLVGLATAKALAAAHELPLAPVDHLHGHVAASFLGPEPLEPPFVSLVASGGHTFVARVDDHGPGYEVLGQTLDDAAGEAFDKGARMLGLGYPGGPVVDRMARRGDPARWPLPVPSLPGLEYSFSGLKTALRYRIRDLGGSEALDEKARADLAAAFERSVVESLLEKVRLAWDRWPAPEVVICGGVAANSLLRRRAEETMEGRARVTIPPLSLCTDNAAMIGAAAPYTPAETELGADASLGW
ncbi:MAG TPA: tRNA (adenosine(37)-N6)-threonylcarbamoyltransferase complex transferase subunit TsaD, partial [Candidatus Dormibacteraeota bacterium]|nr:tRNA (adenosine(37)-N6)-threonylcarbamoyltransferase complex transferase subunit TsaD [Candidatus Dormibacteraeota bacterium]